jgi:hypothetical protein
MCVTIARNRWAPWMCVTIAHNRWAPWMCIKIARNGVGARHQFIFSHSFTGWFGAMFIYVYTFQEANTQLFDRVN